MQDEMAYVNTQTNIRRLVTDDFNRTFPASKPTPHYSKVKKLRPDMYEFIMKKYNGYRAFLRMIKRKMPPTSAKERAFIKYSSNVSRRYYINNWSNLEEYTFAALVLLNEEDNFIHNCSFPSKISKDYIVLLTLNYLKGCPERNDQCPQVKRAEKQTEDIIVGTQKYGRPAFIVGDKSSRKNTEKNNKNGGLKIKKKFLSIDENTIQGINKKYFKSKEKRKEDSKRKRDLNLSKLSAENVRYAEQEIQGFLSSTTGSVAKRGKHGKKFINYHQKNYCPLFNYCARIAILLSTLLESKSTGSFYHLDFFDFDRMLLIEVDGIFHTAIPGQKERDAERDKYIGSFGIRILRLNSNDFKDLRWRWRYRSKTSPR